jgi:hypothetical protein
MEEEQRESSVGLFQVPPEESSYAQQNELEKSDFVDGGGIQWVMSGFALTIQQNILDAEYASRADQFVTQYDLADADPMYEFPARFGSDRTESQARVLSAIIDYAASIQAQKLAANEALNNLQNQIAVEESRNLGDYHTFQAPGFVQQSTSGYGAFLRQKRSESMIQYQSVVSEEQKLTAWVEYYGLDRFGAVSWQTNGELRGRYSAANSLMAPEIINVVQARHAPPLDPNPGLGESIGPIEILQIAKLGLQLAAKGSGYVASRVAPQAMATIAAKSAASPTVARFLAAVDEGQALVNAIHPISPKNVQVRTVFRGERSSASPDVVFFRGLQPKGENTDLLRHVSNNQPDTNFIATSTKAEVAYGFAGKNGYTYVIRTKNGIDVNDALGSKSPFPEQFEIAIPGGVSNSEIMGAFKMHKGNTVGEFIPNPSHSR